MPAVENRGPLFSAQAGPLQGLTQDQERARWWCRNVLTLPALAAQTQVPQTRSRMESERKKSMLTWLVPILGVASVEQGSLEGTGPASPCGESPGSLRVGRKLTNSQRCWP